MSTELFTLVPITASLCPSELRCTSAACCTAVLPDTRLLLARVLVRDESCVADPVAFYYPALAVTAEGTGTGTTFTY